MNSLLSTINRYSNVIIGAAVVVALLFLFRPGKVRDIEPSTDAQFQATVVNESRPVLVKFGATWCGPCVATDKALEEYQQSTKQDVKIVILDVDTNPSITQHYGVSGIPHSFLFWKGKIVDERVGGMDVQGIRDWIKNNEHHWQE